VGDYSKHINALNRIVQNDNIHRTALLTTLALHKKRIFQQGLDDKMTRIGTYDKTPATIKGTYYPGGYAQYKASKGKNPGFVVLRDTDSLQVGYGLKVIKYNSEYGFGHDNSFNFEKTQWMETKYQKRIFAPSEADRKILLDTINAQLNRELQQ
jgi:hypothetical protein